MSIPPSSVYHSEKLSIIKYPTTKNQQTHQSPSEESHAAIKNVQVHVLT